MKKPLVTNSSLGSKIGKIASVICSDRFPTGHRAALRRMTPGQPPPLSFYRFAFEYLPEGWEFNIDDWLTIIAGISIMSPAAHNFAVGLGRALGSAGFSELRLERLLLSKNEVRRILFLRAVRLLAAKSEPFNWVEGARFLLTRDEDRKEMLNLRIAREFYYQQREVS